MLSSVQFSFYFFVYTSILWSDNLIREKQYKDRLAAWHIRKNIKASQVEVMVRKKHKRAARGKQTAFRVNGQDVDPKRIARFVRRYGASWEKQKDKEAEMRSPEPSASIALVKSKDLTERRRNTLRHVVLYTRARRRSSHPDITGDAVSNARNLDLPFALRYFSVQSILATLLIYPDPVHLDSIPDLVIDEEQQHQRQQQHYPLDLHSTQHPALPLPRAYHHPSPFVHSPAQHIAHPHSHQPLHPQVQAQPHPAAPATPATLQEQGEVLSPSDDWNRLDTFQNRLEGLQYTLDRTMSKWARDRDPNQEISHHEGLGM